MEDKLNKEAAENAAQDLPDGAVEVPVKHVRDEKAEEAATEVVEEAAEAAAETAEEAAAEENAEKVAEAETESEAGAVDTVESLRAQLAELKASTDEQLLAARDAVKDAVMRSQADFENYKKRLTREHDEHLKYAAEKVMKDLIPTLDNLELAILYGSKDEACANMMQGVVMTQKLLLEACAKHGLTRIGAEGEAFDPAHHEAMGVASRPELPAESVATVMQSGYSLQGRLLRPAKVMVNRP